ncbi:alpha/beta hydrolase [Enterovirga aerilata]|nr:alpha/beta hydrolase [Enterovirga sp. DB1703]
MRSREAWLETAPPAGVRVRAAHVGGVEGEWLEPRDARADLLYLHGGAYVVGSPATHRMLAGAFCSHGFRVFVPHYRRAPEHPFPAALEDAESAYRGLLGAGLDPRAPAIAGESAGGGLALSLLLRLREAGGPLPPSAALFSPWTDLALSGRSIQANDEAEALFFKDNLPGIARLYLGGAEPRTPLASPLYADLAGLPPLLIHVGEREILLDDALRLAERARDAGVEVTLKRWPVVPHGWQLLQRIVPEAAQSVAEAAEFLRAAAGRRAPGGRPAGMPAPETAE